MNGIEPSSSAWKADILADRIRAGKINREGKVFEQIFAKDLTLTSEQKANLSQPLGTVLEDGQVTSTMANHKLPICAVGDSTLESFIDQHLVYNLGIFDGYKQRQESDRQLESEIKVTTTIDNPAGQISHQLASYLFNLELKTRDKVHLKINGEEDLATAILILALPLASTIFYGQPDKGLVQVTVTEKLKDNLYQLFA